ncbi:MAG TPA: twin-arginine translocation signal domain-containing protein [Burkholderiales bacterium]|nr:twin-arginine translocation signal domain-containing protein [Burkholderiales bacterium]
MSTNKTNRRKFMAALGLGGVAAAGTLLTRQGTPEQQASASKDKAGSGGYRLTEHVRKYYRTTQV